MLEMLVSPRQYLRNDLAKRIERGRYSLPVQEGVSLIVLFAMTPFDPSDMCFISGNPMDPLLSAAVSLKYRNNIPPSWLARHGPPRGILDCWCKVIYTKLDCGSKVICTIRLRGENPAILFR